MANRLVSINTAQSAGEQFPPHVRAEIAELIGEVPGGSGDATSLNGVPTSVDGGELDEIKSIVDGLGGGPGGGGAAAQMTPTAILTADHSASPGTLVRIDSGAAARTVTAPVSPDDQDMFGVWIVNGLNDVSLETGDSANFLASGSGITSYALKSSTSMVGLSVWQYDQPGDFWFPVGLSAVPYLTDVLGTSAIGRSVMGAGTQQAARDALDAASKSDIALLFSSSYEPPVFDVASSVQTQTFTSVSSGSMTGFAFDPALGADVIIAVHGYRTQGEQIILAPTYGGVAVEEVTPMVMGNAAAVNATNASFIQFFRVPGASVDGTSKLVDVNWSAAASVTLTLSVFAMSWTGVDAIGSVFYAGGTETGTTLEQTVVSAPGRIIVQSFGHETISATAIGGYNQTTRTAVPTNANASAIIGTAEGASSVTFAATRTSGADYFEVAFELVGAATSDVSVATWVNVPASATSEGVPGQMAYSATHLYVCVSEDVWRRVAIASW